jgi:hypothetical protein
MIGEYLSYMPPPILSGHALCSTIHQKGGPCGLLSLRIGNSAHLREEGGVEALRMAGNHRMPVGCLCLCTREQPVALADLTEEAVREFLLLADVELGAKEKKDVLRKATLHFPDKFDARVLKRVVEERQDGH